MVFDTKIALIIRSDLEAWQKINVAAFLASGIASEFPECIGEPYKDSAGTTYTRLIGQPILVYGADSTAALIRTFERALARGIKPAIYIKEMFATTNDDDNRKAVYAADPTKLDLVGIAVRADRKIVDKIVDKLKFL